MTHLVLFREDIVVMDMEAGVEHLGRATSASVDALVIVVNPGARSRNAAEKIRKLGKDIGIKRIVVLANRVNDEQDEELIRSSMPDFEIIGFIPEAAEIVSADRIGKRPYENIGEVPEQLIAAADRLKSFRAE